MSVRTAPAPQPGIVVSGASVRRRRWLALLGWLVFATLLTLTVWSINPWFITQSSHPAVTFTQQRFRLLPDATQAGTNWQDVQLPDTWAARRTLSGSGRYEINFTLLQHPKDLGGESWAIRFDRLSFQHTLWLNGHLIHSDLQAEGATGRPMAYMAQVPADLFRPGLNKLEVEVRYGSLGGLSMPLIGRVSDVIQGYNAQSFLTETLPRTINVVSGSFAVFLTMIWLKRRKEVAMGKGGDV